VDIISQLAAGARMLLPDLVPALAVSMSVLALGLVLRRGSAGAALAVGAGFVAAQVALVGWPPFPPREALQRLCYLTLPAIAFGMGETVGGRPWLRNSLFFLLAVAATAGVILTSIRAAAFGDTAAWLTAGGVACLATRTSLNALAKERTRISFAVPLLAVLMGSAVTALQSGNALVGQLALGLLAALTPILAWSFVRPDFSLDGGASSVVALLLPGLGIVGWFYGDMPRASLAILAGVLPVAALARRVPIHSRSKWPLILGRLLVPLLLVCLAVVLAPPQIGQDEGDAYRSWSPPVSSQPAGGAPSQSPVSSPPASAEGNPFEHLPDR
jgi:hypothetical protein